MARTTMTYIINRMERLLNDTSNDVWTDDEIQEALDAHKIKIRRELLIADVDEQNFESRHVYLEGVVDSDTGSWSGSGALSDVINIWDDNDEDAEAQTPDDWNLVSGSFYFSSDQDEPRYLDAVTYNLHAACADLLEDLLNNDTKAALWSRGGVSQQVTSIPNRIMHHRILAGPQSLQIKRVYRSDV